MKYTQAPAAWLLAATVVGLTAGGNPVGARSHVARMSHTL
jgi:hypothetical protein